MQMMFELPPQISALDDLAKMKAAYELAEPLTRHNDFHIIRQTRSGLPSFPPNLYQAKGHLAFGIYTQLYMEPDILHVVSFPEAHHEAKAGANRVPGERALRLLRPGLGDRSPHDHPDRRGRHACSDFALQRPHGTRGGL
jgi:hypothetical protein